MAKQDSNVHEVQGAHTFGGDMKANEPMGHPNISKIDFESKEDENMVDVSHNNEETSIHFESKEDEDVDMESNVASERDSNVEDFDGVIDLEDTETNPHERFPIHNTTVYVAMDETRSVNFRKVANSYGMEFAEVGSSSDALKTIQNILKEKPFVNSIVFQTHRLPRDIVAELQNLVALHFVVIEKKIEQPPMIETSRFYVDELEKEFGKSISITRVYVDNAEKDTRQENLSTQAIDIVLDNPHLDIHAIY